MSELEEWVRHGNELQRPLLVNKELSQHEKIVVVGGGLSGMCAAYRMATHFPSKQIVLVEKSDRLGGVIQTWKQGEWVCDVAVNAARAHPAVWRLMEDLGLSDEWKPSRSRAQSRWVWLDGSKHKLSLFSLLKIGPFKLRKALKESKSGSKPVSEVLPHIGIADAMTLGIVNDTASNVDADFLIPSATDFGPSSPVKRRKLAKLIAQTYPLFSPKKGSVASLSGGMTVLIDTLQTRLQSLENVEVLFQTSLNNPQAASEHFNLPLSSIVWAAPGMVERFEQTTLSVFAVGYREEDVAHVPFGYGLLIPDQTIPISGILYESDLHASSRAPEGHRLFRVMAPHSRGAFDIESVQTAVQRFMGPAQPVIIESIGVRQIPRFWPGHLQRMAEKELDCSYIGWSYSGVSITHVVDEVERLVERVS